MKDFFSKLTFGFFMAQFVPGAVAVISLTYLAGVVWMPPSPSTIQVATWVVHFYLKTRILQALFLSLAIGSGMFIHGIHWGVVGALEGGTGASPIGSVFGSTGHSRPIWLQMLLGPLQIVAELGTFLRAGNIRAAGVSENIPQINKGHIEQLQMVQEFYLNFAQFYLHLSYAALLAIVAIAAHVCHFGITGWRLAEMACLYLISGILFVLGRVQLHTLFNAEVELAERSSWPAELLKATRD